MDFEPLPLHGAAVEHLLVDCGGHRRQWKRSASRFGRLGRGWLCAVLCALSGELGR
jgi:hypothetical protein